MGWQRLCIFEQQRIGAVVSALSPRALFAPILRRPAALTESEAFCRNGSVSWSYSYFRKQMSRMARSGKNYPRIADHRGAITGDIR